MAGIRSLKSLRDFEGRSQAGGAATAPTDWLRLAKPIEACGGAKRICRAQVRHGGARQAVTSIPVASPKRRSPEMARHTSRAERINYAALPTEQPHPLTGTLDRMSVEAVLRQMNRDDAVVPRAVAAQIPSIARAVRHLTGALREGGRIIFVGAGTSGRFGILEAAECPPTFNTPPHLVQAVMAGGRRAVFRSQEGAEDRAAEAAAAIRRRVRPGDAVIGVAASGVTPYVRSALQAARRRGAMTILVSCNARSPVKRLADVAIVPRTGPEVIAGSTRLKAGTATKLVLNMLTVATMVQIGKVYGHWMVDLQPRSRKLTARAVRLVCRFAGLPERRAARLLRQAGGNAKRAIVMGRLGVSSRTAQRSLHRYGGFLRPLLKSASGSRRAS